MIYYNIAVDRLTWFNIIFIIKNGINCRLWSPMQKPRLRYQLILGKFPVTQVKRGLTNLELVLDLGKGLYLITHAPDTADVRQGDLLTLYTEVLAKDHPNA